MYGSQTGNAQSIAEGVHRGCKERGLDSTLLACDGWKKVRGAKIREWRQSRLVRPTAVFLGGGKGDDRRQF